MLGLTQAKRLECMEKAVTRGDLQRLRCLFDSGVDLDANLNEYGHTALFLACYLGRVDAARMLLMLWAADPTCTANGGLSTCFDAAVANGAFQDDPELLGMLRGDRGRP
jgi:hypothetical protein